MTTENEIEIETPEQDVPEVSVSGMIDKIFDGQNSEAQTDFESIISAKLADAMDAKKIEIAQSMYGGDEEDNDQYEDTEEEDEDTEEEDEDTEEEDEDDTEEK